MKLTIIPKSEKYDNNHIGWQEQIYDLRNEFIKTDAESIVEGKKIPNAKGIINDIILGIGSTGILTSVVDIIKAWIIKDPTRKLIIKFSDDEGKEVNFEIDSTGLSKKRFDEIADLFLSANFAKKSD